MDSKIVLNEYIKTDIVCDILSQSIAAARKRVANEDSKEAKELLDKLLKYDEEVQAGNKDVIDMILRGEV